MAPLGILESYWCIIDMLNACYCRRTFRTCMSLLCLQVLTWARSEVRLVLFVLAWVLPLVKAWPLFSAAWNHAQSSSVTHSSRYRFLLPIRDITCLTLALFQRSVVSQCDHLDKLWGVSAMLSAGMRAVRRPGSRLPEHLRKVSVFDVQRRSWRQNWSGRRRHNALQSPDRWWCECHEFYFDKHWELSVLGRRHRDGRILYRTPAAVATASFLDQWESIGGGAYDKDIGGDFRVLHDHSIYSVVVIGVFKAACWICAVCVFRIGWGERKLENRAAVFKLIFGHEFYFQFM